jgi:hypothetical protein
MTKNRDPYAMPAAPGQRARIERSRERRAAARSERDLSFTPRYIATGLGVAFIVALIAFSLQWSNGPGPALIAGAITFVGVVILAVGLRLLQRRSAAA